MKGEEEEVYGHAGMLGAAAAVWEDLRSHHILAALLNLPAEEECSSHLDGRGDDSRMSRSEREHHMEWNSSASLPDDGRLDQKSSPAKGPMAQEQESVNKPCPGSDSVWALLLCGASHLNGEVLTLAWWKCSCVWGP